MAAPKYNAMADPAVRRQPPNVLVVGAIDHREFCDVRRLLENDANVVGRAATSAELVVVAQDRPGIVRSETADELRAQWPLAGIVALAGSWCEGELRTGRPWAGVHRLYWYEFPNWWRRQLAARAAGRCPDWCRSLDFGLRIACGEPGRAADCGLKTSPQYGLVVIQSPRRENADALSDALNFAGFATVWQRTASIRPHIRGPVAGIWDGAQLNEREEATLAAFCDQLTGAGVPVLAILDFPRRDRIDRAVQIGATAVIGKPWLNSNLVATLDTITAASQGARAA